MLIPKKISKALPATERIKRRKASVKKYNDKRYKTKEWKEWSDEYKRKGGRREVLKKYRKTKHHREQQRRYIKKRYNEDTDFKLKTLLRNRLKKALKGNYKSGLAIEALGCSIDELKRHLETQFTSGMSWDNYGEWHIDHIYPLSKIDSTDSEQVYAVCNYKNLQPLWAIDNRLKGDEIKLPLKTQMNNKKLIEDYLDRSDWRLNENSNMSFSVQGLNNYIASSISAEYWLQELYPPRIKEAHVNGNFHIHDLGILSPYCFAGETRVKLLDGTSPTLLELSEKYERDEEFWVYSRDKDSGEIIPAKAINPRKTRADQELIEIELDNKEKIKCTPDHKFMLKNGDYIEASELTIGRSLSPLYVHNRGAYHGINYVPGSEMYVHRYIAERYSGVKVKDYEVVHHKNGNKRDNRPDNLEVITDVEHRRHELAKTKNSSKWKAANKKTLIKRNKSEEQIKMVSDLAKSRPRDHNGRFENHKVIGVKTVREREDVYCLTVPYHENFALDAGVFVHNCVGWDLKDLLMKGFGGVKEKTQSSPPKHFKSALGQLVNFFYTLQGEAAGAQAVASFDTYLAPFVREDGLTQSGVKQGLQEFVFNVNVPTRVGFQSPFTNITMDVIPSDDMKKEHVIIGGELMDETYGEYQPEMDMINKAFAEVMIDGDSTGRMFSFPIPTYNIDKEFDWDNPALEKMWEMTAKYGIPYFANYHNSDMDKNDVRSMCCRLSLDLTQLRKRGGGLFGSNPLTGSINVVTLNMSRIGYNSKTEEEYLERVSELMELAMETCEIKREILEDLTNDGLYPYSKYYLSGIYERFGKYWSNHFSTIGINGMNESMRNFLGKDISSKEGQGFAVKVLDFMRSKLEEFQDKTGNLYNLEASPAEGAMYRFAKKDKELYPDIITANEEAVKDGANPYYTNSSHLPVGFTGDLFEALDLQDELQTKYTGGTVLHGFIGERLDNGDAAKNLVKKVITNYKLPYFSVTPTFSVCPVHGYLNGEHEFCPKCDEEIGYISTEDREEAVVEINK